MQTRLSLMGSDWELQAADAVTAGTDDDDLELSHLLNEPGAGRSCQRLVSVWKSLLMQRFNHRSIA